MEKEFVPFDLTLKLIELGINFKSLGGYVDGELFLWQDNDTTSFIHCEVEAPLWQQTFDWFREKYDINGEVQTNLPLTVLYVDEEGHTDEELQWQYNYRIILNKDGIKCDVWESKSINTFTHYDTFEEARIACLEKLIEIVENNKQ